MEWKTVIVDGEVYDYEVSENGDIRNKRNGKLLKWSKNSNGYYKVSLRKDGDIKQFYVHRLVGMMFVPNDDATKKEINHIDEDKSNNHYSNIEWCDRTYNVNYGDRTRKASKTQSKKVIGKSLTENKVIILQSTQQAKLFGFSQSAVCDCCNGKIRQHKGYVFSYVK